MERNEWLLADKNIQYRIMNAIIKERISPDGMTMTETSHHVELQYHGKILSVHVERKSAMERYVFSGDVIYSCGHVSQPIESLEDLLETLTQDFDIEISERLYEELIHSRDSFIETYKHFNNRQSLIHQSMKFARLPESLNFISWLQHLQENGIADDLSYSESLIVEGHPTHPLTKTKLPLTTNELKAYAPEFEKVIPLNIMLIEKNHIVTTSMENDAQYILNKVIPEYRSQLSTFLEPLNLDIDDYRVMIVHPWQYEHTIGEKYKQWIADKILIPTPFTLESKATLSFRTMDLIHKPYHVKLPVNVQATSAVRTVSTVTTVDGPKLSYALQGLLDQYPGLQVAMEPFGAYADVEPDLARQLACIIRQKPVIFENGTTVVTASLVNPNPIDHKAIVDSYLEWLENDVTIDHIKYFIATYTQTLVKPLIAYIQDYGIALEAHMQNTIVNLGPNYQMKFLVHDLGGSRIDLTTLQQKIDNIEVTNESLLAQSIEEVIAKFQHAVVQNQLAELIHHFNQYEDVVEKELFDIVQEEIEIAIDDDKAHADILRKVLFGPTITVKALLSMRMENKVKKYLNTELDNPIKKEV
ncbi:IucA/IucC family protein [Staphylococcus caprae]|uniref:IucA/IucC family protein n=1 Tax=Staphylococcus caprae TaxID=29380 RepID=UPI0005C8ED18|nr:IucA/IucC family protein [Staphylococcus caprae]